MTRLALCGGVYSNPYALRAFVEQARVRGAKRLFCLGDFGAYGAEPEAIWPLPVDHGIECLAGNYEVAIGSRQPEFAAWMRTLPTERREIVDGTDVHLVHGSTMAVNDFWWESLPIEQHRLRVAASRADVICGWHWHLAAADLDTSPDFLLGGPEVAVVEAKRRVVQRFLELRQADVSLPVVLNCAV